MERRIGIGKKIERGGLRRGGDEDKVKYKERLLIDIRILLRI